MRIEILDKAENDLVEGYRFYEAQQSGLGSYFIESLYSDIESLCLHAGVHRIACKNLHRLLSKRFPFAIYYSLTDKAARIHAVVVAAGGPHGFASICNRKL